MRATLVRMDAADILFIFYILIMSVLFIVMLVCIIRLITSKKEKRRQMKKTKLAAVISALIVTISGSVTIYLFIKLPPPPPPPPPWDVGRMPNIIGLTYEECEENFSDFFELVVEEKLYSSEYPEGTIIEQNPVGGADYLVGRTTVKCCISKGVRMVTVGNVIGLDFEDSKGFLENSGFTVGFVSEYSDDVPKGKVIATDPPEFEKAAYGSAVKVTVSGGKEPDVTDITDINK